jgi:hypothetical protein
MTKATSWATPDNLTRGQLPTRTITIDRIGKIKLRGLNRAEATQLQYIDTDTLGGFEQREIKMLMYGVESMVLDEATTRAWRDSAPSGELEKITEVIAELSGVGQGQDREASKSVRCEPSD